MVSTESCEIEILTLDGKPVWKKWLGDPLMSMPPSPPAKFTWPIRTASAELFGQFLGAMHDAHTAFDLRFGREAFPTLAHHLEKNGISSKCCWSTIHRLSV